MKTLIIAMVALLSGCGGNVTANEIEIAAVLCGGNGGVEKLIVGPVFRPFVICKNGARFEGDEVGNKQRGAQK